MAVYEDPKDQLFHDSMELQMEIAKDTNIDAVQRVKALNDLQTTYLTFQHNHVHEEMADAAVKIVKSSAADQARRLRGKNED